MTIKNIDTILTAVVVIENDETVVSAPVEEHFDVKLSFGEFDGIIEDNAKFVQYMTVSDMCELVVAHHKDCPKDKLEAIEFWKGLIMGRFGIIEVPGLKMEEIPGLQVQS